MTASGGSKKGSGGARSKVPEELKDKFRVSLDKVVDELTPEQKKAAWEKAIFERHHGACSNCGNSSKVRVKMIVPLEAGGRLIADNGVTLCRACEMASAVAARGAAGQAQRPVNFWVSEKLYTRIKEMNGFNSMGSLVRFLMSTYVRDPGRFDDLDCWQERGSDTKINVWVDRDVYEIFKELVNQEGITVTNALKGLILLYEAEAEPLVQHQSPDGAEHD